MKSLRYNRAVVPEDAISLDLDTLDFGDTSSQMACAAIYVRFKRRNGQFSYQLILSRSKIIPDQTSQSRAELNAALLNTNIVRRALKKHHKKSIKLTDSQIVLHWISNDDRSLKSWVRNRVIEVRRFTND